MAVQQGLAAAALGHNVTQSQAVWVARECLHHKETRLHAQQPMLSALFPIIVLLTSVVSYVVYLLNAPHSNQDKACSQMGASVYPWLY